MKIKLLALLMFVGFGAKAQVDSTEMIVFPFSIAKQIQMDLLQKDSVEEALEYAAAELGYLEAKLYAKDTMIAQYSKNLHDMSVQLDNEKALKLTYKGIAEDCKTEFDKMSTKFSFYKKKSTFGSILLGGVALGLASIILIKL